MIEQEIAASDAKKLREAFEVSMGRIRRANELPKADLEGRYKKAYKNLLCQAAVEANRIKSAAVFGNLKVDAAHAESFRARMDKFFAEEFGTMQQREIAAIKRGDHIAIYAEITAMQKIAREAAGYYDNRPDAQV